MKGGGGCLLAFFALALLAVMAGGEANIDAGGVIVLFVGGGIVGIIVVAIYNKGRKDGEK